MATVPANSTDPTDLHSRHGAHGALATGEPVFRGRSYRVFMEVNAWKNSWGLCARH